MMQQGLICLRTTMQVMSGHSAAPSCPLETTDMDLDLVPAPNTPTQNSEASALPTANAATAMPTLPVEVLHCSSVVFAGPSNCMQSFCAQICNFHTKDTCVLARLVAERVCADLVMCNHAASH